MKYLITIQKEIPITDNEYPYNNRGFETVIENRIGYEDWTKYITHDMTVLGVFSLTNDQAMSLPYENIKYD